MNDLSKNTFYLQNNKSTVKLSFLIYPNGVKTLNFSSKKKNKNIRKNSLKTLSNEEERTGNTPQSSPSKLSSRILRKTQNLFEIEEKNKVTNNSTHKGVKNSLSPSKKVSLDSTPGIIIPCLSFKSEPKTLSGTIPKVTSKKDIFVSIFKNNCTEFNIPESFAVSQSILSFYDQFLSKLDYLNEQMMEIYSRVFCYKNSKRLKKSNFQKEINK